MTWPTQVELYRELSINTAAERLFCSTLSPLVKDTLCVACMCSYDWACGILRPFYPSCKRPAYTDPEHTLELVASRCSVISEDKALDPALQIPLIN